MPNFLVNDWRTGSGGQCVAYIYNNASPSQLGDPFGTTVGATFQEGRSHDGIIQFQGEIYAVARDGVYKKDDPTSATGGWTIQITFTSPSATHESFSGIHVADIGGTQYLFGVFPQSNTLFRWFKFDGTTWTQAASGTSVAGVNTSALSEVVVWRNSLYAFMGASKTTLIFDPGAESFSAAPNHWYAAQYNPAFCVYQDRLFGIGPTSTGSINWYLQEFAGGVWTDFQEITFTGATAVVQNGRCGLFSDGTYLFAVFPLDSTGGPTFDSWRCVRWNSSFSRSDLTAECLPDALINNSQFGGSFSGDPNPQSLVPVYDTSTGQTDIYLYHAVNTTVGTPYTMYKWNYDPIAHPAPDPLNKMTSVDSGGSVRHALPTGYPNHGERVFTPGELDIKITARAPEPGGERISFIAYGGGTGRKMKLYYSLNGTPPLLEGTLIDGSVTGGSATFNAGLNQVEGIDANGTTVYSVLWGAQTDGLVVGDRAIRVPQIAV